MLDLAGLPKNANGFRTTHTCELCGFEPKTKNKYREKQDHLVMKHFKERIDKIFPHCRPYSCPNLDCEFVGKDKQALLRHYTGKHGVLELFLREALVARGIPYNLSDSAKRKSMGNTDSAHRDGGRREKQGRLSPGPEEKQLVEQFGPESPVYADTTTILPSEFSAPEPVTFVQAITRLPAPLPANLTTKLPSMATVFTGQTARPQPIKSEVDMMLASFQPSQYQITSTALPPAVVRSTSPRPLNSSVVSSTTLDLFLPPAEPSELLLHDNIMWGGGGSSAVAADSAVPVEYLETTEQGFVNLGDVDYDYLYPATVDPTAGQAMNNDPSEQRLLSFSML